MLVLETLSALAVPEPEFETVGAWVILGVEVVVTVAPAFVGPAVIVTGLRAPVYIDGAKVPENVVADRAVPLSVRLHSP